MENKCKKLYRFLDKILEWEVPISIFIILDIDLGKLETKS